MKVKLSLDQQKHRKLLRGLPVQLTKAMIGIGPEFNLPEKIVKQIQKAQKAGRGYRLRVDERDIEGSGLKEFFAKLKKGGKKAKEFYDKHLKADVGPLIKEGLSKLADTGLAAAKIAAPGALQGVVDIGVKRKDDAIDALGRLTGAFGIMTKDGFILLDNFSPMTSPYAPAFTPLPPSPGFQQLGSYLPPPTKGGEYLMPPKKRGRPPKGGSFRTIGGSFAAI